MENIYLNKIKDETTESVCGECVIEEKYWGTINCNRLACIEENCHYSEGTKEQHDLIIQII